MSDLETRLPPALLRYLHERYGEGERAFHSWHHVEELLALHREVEHSLSDPDAVLLAVLFHDAIYDSRARDNELRSATALRQEAAGHYPPATIDRAARMVLATIRHELPAGLDEQARADMAHFLDMDLATLGSPPERFAEYGEQIRREHAHLPDEAFHPARAAVLRRFAERPQLYFSDWGRARFERQARENLEAALA